MSESDQQRMFHKIHSQPWLVSKMLETQAIVWLKLLGECLSKAGMLPLKEGYGTMDYGASKLGSSYISARYILRREAEH